MLKEELIKGLTTAYGIPVESKYAESHFDTATGTFYCNGHVMTAGKIEQALRYFEASKGYVEAGSDVYMFCELAQEAIKLMQKNGTINGSIIMNKNKTA
ncbi:MAG: hypothetical protein IJ589_03590 [Lachnospiraceae bacterium]|nr:hypothetical protein [Lachnospiraceae bacterium]